MNMDGAICSLSIDVLLSAILFILPLNILLESQHSLVNTVCVCVLLCKLILFEERESNREREGEGERERERDLERGGERDRIPYSPCSAPSDPIMSPTLAP